MGRAGRALANLGLALASLLLFLAAAELCLRLFAPQLSAKPVRFEPHPVLGWKFAADQRSEFVFPGMPSHRVQTNADGFRDAPFERDAPGTRRIAVLGDSFVSNLAVADDEVFTEVMERRLPGVSVMNLGVNGYGQTQQLLLLRAVLRDLAPELVVVVVYLRNDFDDNTGHSWGVDRPRPTAVLDAKGERVGIRRPPVAAVQDHRGSSWLGSLHVARFLSERLGRLRLRPARGPRGAFVPSPETPPELYLAAKHRSPETRQRFRVMELLLLEMARLAAEHDVPIVFALAPSMAQVVPEVWQELLDRTGADPAELDREAPDRDLLAFGDAHGLRVLDLLPALREAQAGGAATYHSVQQHWTPEANRVVAEALLEFLRGDLSRRPPGPDAAPSAR